MSTQGIPQTNGKFQLHVSGLNMLSKCGIQFEFRYVRGVKRQPGVALAVGIAVDRTVTSDLQNKIETGQLLPAEQLKDIARDEIMTQWQYGVELEEDYAAMGHQKAQAEAIDTSVALAALHHREAAPKIQPTHVQRPWVLDIAGLPIQLAGTIDVQEGLSAIRDTKTSKKSPAGDAADISLQLTTYCLAVKVHDGATPERVVLDYLVHTKTPKLVQIESKRTDKDYPHLLERVYQAHRMIEAGLFMPAPLDAWWCSAKWCGYHAQCKYAARPVTVAA